MPVGHVLWGAGETPVWSWAWTQMPEARQGQEKRGQTEECVHGTTRIRSSKEFRSSDDDHVGPTGN